MASSLFYPKGTRLSSFFSSHPTFLCRTYWYPFFLSFLPQIMQKFVGKLRFVLEAVSLKWSDLKTIVTP